jgi:hypothetical protein
MMDNETARFLGPKSDWHYAVVELPTCGGGPNRPTPWVYFVCDDVEHDLPNGHGIVSISLARGRFVELLDYFVEKNVLTAEAIGVPVPDEPTFRIKLKNKGRYYEEGRMRADQRNPDFQAVWDRCWALYERR